MSTFIIGSIIMAAFAKVGYDIYKRKRSKSGCGGDCSGCGGSCGCH